LPPLEIYRIKRFILQLKDKSVALGETLTLSNLATGNKISILK